MSSMTKVVLGIVVLIVIVGAGYWYMHGTKTNTADETATTQGESSDQNSISAQLTAIDGQIQAFDSDDAAVDAGMSDQPVDQSTL
jgi:CHASE3 domain sensor protein